MKRSLLLLSLISAFVFTSCEDNPLKKVDVSKVPVSVKIDRFEKDLFALSSSADSNAVKRLNAKYPEFFERFNQGVISIGSSKDPGYMNNLSMFTSDKNIRQLYDDCQDLYKDLSKEEKELTDAFRHYRFYFPQRTIPHIFTFISGFNYALITDDSTLALGIDMYMGPGYKFYSMLPQLPQYVIAKMERENLVADAIRGWCLTEFEPAKTKDLLSEMIYYGKIHYLMDALVPEMEDSVKIGYTTKQWEWATENEFEIWSYFIERKLLYSKNDVENAKYINEAPFSAGMPNESAPKTAIFTGWKIIRAYMEKHPQISISELMKNNDAQKILVASGYKPKK